MKRSAILCSLALLFTSGCASVSALGGTKIREHVHSSVASAGLRTVRIVNVSGPISVSAARGPMATVDATKSANDQGAIDRTHVDVHRNGTDLEVRTTYDEDGGSHNGASVDYVIRVPAGVSVDVTNVSGSINVAGIAGDIRATAVSGEVTAVAGRVDGDRDVRLRAVSGPLRLQMTANSNVTLSAKSLSGGVHVFFPADIHHGFVGSDLSGRLGSGSASVTLSTISGAISVTQQ
jgi:DUF4097 and DUF4098 domain-containing protein YvlB